MPFVLNEYDDAFSSFISDAIRILARAGDPLLSGIEVEESPGALGSVFEDADGREVELVPESVSAGLTMKLDAVRDGDIDALVVEINLAAEQMREGMARMLFASLDTVTAATGNVAEANGKFTFELFYEMLDQIEWSLTDDDELSLPTLVMNPKTVESLPALTADQQAALDALKARKLSDLLARRRRRRLS